MDIFVAASRLHSESFGVAVVEASACGIPVVVADVGGLPEVVDADTTGLVIPPERPDLLARALVQLATEPSQRRALGQAGRQRVLSTYAWPMCAARMDELLELAIRNYQDRAARPV
jgi:glycosyltransferase involved in cell wall biosynthesis